MTKADETSPPGAAVEYALDYASRGWHVFPCSPANKAPLVGSKKDAIGNSIPRTGGLYKATTDEALIRALWHQWPHAMIGVRMGAASRVWAIDPDAPKQQRDPDGRAAWASLLAQHGPVHTHTHLTPGGGKHVLFKWDSYRPLTNREGGLRGMGINVRGEGGYIIAPPSQRSDGKEYSIAEPLDFFRFADAPDWLYELILQNQEQEPLVALRTTQGYNSTYRRAYTEAALCNEAASVAAELHERNNRLNKAAMSLGTLVGAGLLSESEVIGALYEASIANCYVASDGHRATMATINSGLQAGILKPRRISDDDEWPHEQGRRPGEAGNGQQLDEQLREDEQSNQPLITATPYVWQNPELIPERDWLYGHHLIRKFVSATIAPGGVGKSSLVIAEALAMATGKALLGTTPARQMRVWLWNLEDPRDEITRRIQATAKHYGLTSDDVSDHLYMDSGREQKLIIADMTRTGAVIVRPIVDALLEEILTRHVDVLVVDPFVSCHRVSENDNSAIDMVAKEWSAVADRGNCAVELVHHTRKMVGVESEVTTESSRGGKALTDACRSVRAINRMSKDEGESAGVEAHRLYFRTYNDKNNLAPPPERSDWFKLHSVDLENGRLGPGDSIGVVTQWTWPDPMESISVNDLRAIQLRVKNGQWRENSQAKNWVGNPIGAVLKLDVQNRAHRSKIKGMLKIWIANGMFVVVQGKDDKGNERPFVEVGEWASD